MRIAVVVQRYGDEVVGGAELHARWIAQRLAARHDVQVLTTCAIDYLTWQNEYDPGATTVGGLPVLRFEVTRRRSPEGFDALAGKVQLGPHTDAEERRWMDEHGPVTPGLVDHLRREGERWDAIVFFSYRYWTTFHGLSVHPAKSILVPTAEHDTAIRLRLFRDFFRKPAALAFNSPEERELLLEVSGAADLPGEVVGVGIEDVKERPADEVQRRLDVLGDYVVYVGRIEREKGCATLFDHFLRYVREVDPHLNLVLVGRAVLPIPVHVNVTHLGVLPEAEKLQALAAARVFVHPSPFESLSMALLEAWKMRRPALVNGRCEVLRGQVQRAQGGLWYASYEEFAEALGWLRAHPAAADAMGRSGRAYYEANYAWDVVMQRWEQLLARVPARAR